MKLSAPIYRLKRKARMLSRQAGIPHHEALDRVAREEGFRAWSLLAGQLAENRTGQRLSSELRRGDLVVVAARPGQGKTLLSLQIAVEAMNAGQRSVFFSLACNKIDVGDYFAAIGENPAQFADKFDFDDSDEICAEYMIRQLQPAAPGTVVIVDYLQSLDQKRTNADLMEQVQALKAFAVDRGLILLFISQVHRHYDSARNPVPGLDDIRLPNPLDLGLFDKACFLHGDQLEFAAIA
jgi:replicative DNA helicase